METIELLPRPKETVAISLKPKTAALCFNRVWAYSDELVPRSIRFFGGTLREDPMRDIPGAYNLFKQENEQLARSLSTDEFRIVMEALIRSLKQSQDDKHSIVPFYMRVIARRLWKSHGIRVTPIYSSAEDQQHAYSDGKLRAACLALENIPIVLEEELEWKQVKEFRQDKGVQRKYTKFLEWLSTFVDDKNQAAIEDKICELLKGYKFAIRKYGLKTTIGTVAALIALAKLFQSPHISTGDALFVVSGVSLIVAKLRLDLEADEYSATRAIAWIHEVKKLGMAPGAD